MKGVCGLAFLQAIKQYLKQIDLLLLVLSLLATGFGVVLIASATKSYGSESYVQIQLIAAAVGLLLFFLLSVMDVESLCGIWKVLYVLNLLLISSLIFFGTGAEDTGNRSWIRFGGIGVQPAEVGKILFILTLSGHIYSLKDEITNFSSLIKLLIHAFLPIVLIVVVSGDLGSALAYLAIFLIMIFCAGVKLRWFACGIGITAAAAPFLWTLLRADQQMRIRVVFNPELDPLGRGYHAIQSKIALGAGGIFGRGLGGGTQTQYGYLPAKQTDFIFAVAGEELGLIGCLIIMALLTAIIIRCFVIANRSGDSPTSLVCIGVGGMMLFQTIENIGMCIGLMPIIGLTLPFFSYGGSSVLTVFWAIALVSAAKMRASKRLY
ncbi:MAG: rod shape-determining protein RodA [Ruminococcaceae bacterium]|nr:rod shape-determining protein RodA [Oscillospiraceae bacterium]